MLGESYLKTIRSKINSKMSENITLHFIEISHRVFMKKPRLEIENLRLKKSQISIQNDFHYYS